ncbi:MAG: Ig-like domain-containing protein [Gammaproteobacteria bacterium]|nr:Ig-like domain-containing protein [Gammaproteobacteria bacterium]
MKCKFGVIGALGISLLIAGCGGGSLNGGDEPPPPIESAVQLGSVVGGAFQAGVLEITTPQLSAGGSTTVSAALQYTDGTPYTGSATITFTSSCYQNGLATFTVDGEATNAVTTATGQANITYSAKGCSGSDTITATTSIDADTLTATGVVTVAPASVGFIQFVSATPDIISLNGTGGPQTSTVIFQVTNSSGGPVPGARVEFSLDTTVGGITLAPSSATTGNNGQAQTIVRAGTQHTTVRVTATVHTDDGRTISTQSPGIVISTGIPTQKHFSLSLSKHNLEGFNTDGLTSSVQVILSDRFGNPVPDGTQIAFTTNGGQIGPSCTTLGGSCSVPWTSANPRPSNGPLSVIGHATILAYATGEESFTDVNGDGIFNVANGVADTFSLVPNPGAPNNPGDNFYGMPTADEIGEVYLDQNQNGAYDLGEFFFDFNHDSVRNNPGWELAAKGARQYHGYGCEGPVPVPDPNNPGATIPVQCGTSTVGVGLEDCIVMTTSAVVISGPGNLNPGQSVTYSVSDLNGNVPPAGMQFTILANGADASVLQEEVPDIGGCPIPPAAYTINVTVSATSQPGSFRIQAVSPQGLVSYSNAITVN